MTASNNLLFSWADVEQRPELQRLQLPAMSRTT